MDIKKEVGNKLRDARKKKKLQQNTVAKMIGVDNSTLNKYESGEREVDYETIVKLAELYEVTSDSLLGVKLEKNKIIDNILELSGSEDSESRKIFADVFYEEFNKLPNDTKKSLFSLIRTIPKE